VRASKPEFNGFYIVFGYHLAVAKGQRSLLPAPKPSKGKYTLISAAFERCVAGYPIFDLTRLVNIGRFYLTFPVKIGYNALMFGNIIFFVLRIWLIAALWGFIWRAVEPRTQLMRILRAALLLIGLLGILAVLRIMGC